MCRSLSYGYNAGLAISELVADRLIGAIYDDPDFPHTYAEPVTGLPTTVHIHISKPRLTFDASRPERNAVLYIDRLEGVSSVGERFTATVDVEFLLITDSGAGTLRPDFDAVELGDITVTSTSPVAEALLPSAILNTIQDGRFDALEIPLDFGQALLGSDRLDLRVIDDTTGADHDNLNLMFFDSADGDSHGEIGDVASFLEEDSTFTLLLSQAAFDARIEQELDRRFMHFDLTVPETEETTSHRIVVSPPDAAGQVALSGESTRSHSYVSGTIRNVRTDEEIGFACDAEGVFSVSLAATAGDVLEVRGDRLDIATGELDGTIPIPTITLADGHITISGTVHVHEPISEAIEYEGRLWLSIDPRSGTLAVEAQADVEMPWWADFIAWCAGVSAEDEVAETIETLVGPMSRALLPGLDMAGRMAVFYESVTVSPDGIILSGQIEAGRLVTAGQMARDVVPLTGSLLDQVRLDLERRTIAIDAGGLTDLADSAFEQIDVDYLAARAYPATELPLPAVDAALEGRVFGVRTIGGRHAKLRISLWEGALIIRWVTYERNPEPAVAIVGDWEGTRDVDMAGRSGFGIHSVGADHYEGDFTASVSRIHHAETGEAEFRWSVERPATGTPGRDGAEFRVELDTDDLTTETFHLELEVTVTDIFGRSAASSRMLHGSKTRHFLRVPDRAKEPLWDRKRFPWKVEELVKRLHAVEEESAQVVRGNKDVEKLREELYALSEEVDSMLEATSSSEVEAEIEIEVDSIG
jgi:hypothetical protein